MLKTTSEELACPREDLSVARKEELRKLLLDQVQTVLGLLTGEQSGGAKASSLPWIPGAQALALSISETKHKMKNSVLRSQHL